MLDRLSTWPLPESRRFSWPVDAIHARAAFYTGANEQAIDGRVCLLSFTGNCASDGSTRLCQEAFVVRTLEQPYGMHARGNDGNRGGAFREIKFGSLS